MGAPRKPRSGQAASPEQKARDREANRVALVMSAIALVLLGPLGVGAFRDVGCSWGLSLGAGLPIVVVAGFITLATWFDAATWSALRDIFWMRFVVFAVLAVLLTLGVHFLFEWPWLASTGGGVVLTIAATTALKLWLD
jgi:hypothetical protein